MERLTRKITNMETGNVLAYTLNSRRDELKAYRKLGEFEDLEEQGLLLRLPCKVGDTVYHILPLPSGKKVIAEVENVDSFFLALSAIEGRFGKTVFLTKAEAEAALEKMKGE